MNTESAQDFAFQEKAIIICDHIAVKGLPILLAIRTEPTCNEDSGWQILCNSGQLEKEENAQIWKLIELLDYEPSLAPYITLPPGTVLRRGSETATWAVGRIPRVE